MSGYEIGYRKPPKHSQFKKGVCPNPSGRGKRHALDVSETMKRVLHSKIEFRDRGKVKKTSRIELVIRKLVTAALTGDVGSAALLLDVSAHSIKYGDTAPMVIRITGGLGLNSAHRTIVRGHGGHF